ncbi:dihydrofolate reductase [Ruminiclostridium sufflavum DSM 19573]|uniref:Dihydrofolate reductase n=1 Tax=Ruminiclostridium sufflavum DSM 19573 TaxID=1121337 RepID=A0A318Y4J1_9FIRM|nr:dihydrofolate reductase [Ruminiclostridium sufflavum]PYG86951.1 dihydrofolate reductase [Ruminiclostridium sufflavum DSM 19573]
MISIIFAMGKDNAIGYKNKMPWHLPADLAYFKRATMGQPVIMGRKTFESIGRPLPGRTNIVITGNKEFFRDGCIIADSVEKAAETVKSTDCFVIGGAEIYRAFLPIAGKLYITEINQAFEADTFFPELDYSQWKLVSREPGVKDEKNPYDYAFLVYERIEP